MNLIHLRPMTKNDESFVYSSWLNGAREEFMHMAKKTFFGMYKVMVTGILAKSSVLVACDPENYDHILGYLVYKRVDDALILHWSYVKSPFRQKGVLTGMIEALTKSMHDPLIITTQVSVVVPYKNPRRDAPKSDSISESEAAFKTARRLALMSKFKMIYKPEYRGI